MKKKVYLKVKSPQNNQVFAKIIGKMKVFSRLKNILPSPLNAVFVAASAILLILSFPDFEFWILAWVALVPLFFAIERERESWKKSFVIGWIFGTIFFFGTCWWLTFAPITYASLPTFPIYLLMLCSAMIVGIFPAIFAVIFSILLKKFGVKAILSAPFLWVFTEFLRMTLTGNNWNAIAYSQAFGSILLSLAKIGGVYFVSFVLLCFNCFAYIFVTNLFNFNNNAVKDKIFNRRILQAILLITPLLIIFAMSDVFALKRLTKPESNNFVIAVQPNVPMDGLTIEKYEKLLKRHIELAENELKKQTASNEQRTTVVFPESPMMFQYGRDAELQEFFRKFAVRNNVSILFNSAEMTKDDKRILNSAVMINEKGEKTAQYDKIHLVPFGEYIPLPEPFASQMPAFVGNFQYGDEYDLLDFGAAKGGVMICFESHFGSLSREYVKNGADVLVEMTNDGYLGKTPVLRQHLANAVFRAVETNRPLIRVTNVGITAFITESGEILNSADVYQEATRVFTVSKSDGRQTIYVKYGNWFAWLCSLVSLAVLFLSFLSRKNDEK